MEGNNAATPESRAETHVLDLPENARAKSGSNLSRVTLKIEFFEAEIVVRIDTPTRLPRKGRRIASRWLGKVFKTLDRDTRPLRLVTMCGEKVLGMGYENKGICAVVWP